VARTRLIALSLAAAFALAACASASRPDPVAVRIDPSRLGRTVPRSFLGLSIEWDSVESYTGPAARRSDGLRSLLAPLAAATGGLALRVGGDTADQAWWDPRGRPRPPTVLQNVTPATLGDIAWLARVLRGPVTLDLNLALGDPGNARALAQAAARRLPRGALDTLEIGNEPDLYTRARRWRVPGHLHVRVRKRISYGPADYRRSVLRYLGVLSAPPRPAPHLAIAGFAGRAWWPALPGLIHAGRGRVGALSGHLYALSRCGGAAPPASWLMTATASRGRAASMAPLIALARRERLPVRITELNSAACGGRPDFSDTPAATLWLTDTLFALLRDGADQADVHTWAHARYAAFAVGGQRAAPRAPFAAMAAFARAAPPGSRLVAARGGGENLRTWATIDRAGTVRVALIARAAVKARVVAGGSRCALALPPRTITVLTISAGCPCARSSNGPAAARRRARADRHRPERDAAGSRWPSRSRRPRCCTGRTATGRGRRRTRRPCRASRRRGCARCRPGGRSGTRSA
jgi:hypothetical protein